MSTRARIHFYRDGVEVDRFYRRSDGYPLSDHGHGVIPDVLKTAKRPDMLLTFERLRTRVTYATPPYSYKTHERIPFTDHCDYAFMGLDYVYRVDITTPRAPLIEVFYVWPFDLRNLEKHPVDGEIPGRLGAVRSVEEWGRVEDFDRAWRRSERRAREGDLSIL